MDGVWRCDGADFLAHPGDQFLAEHIGGLNTRLQRDIGVNTLALDVMRHANHGGFRNRRVRHQRAFNLGRAHAVAGHVNHVIHAAGDPVIAIGITPRAIAGEIHALEGGKIGLHEAFMVAINRAHLPGPAIQDHQIALGRAIQKLTFTIHQSGHHARQRQRGGTWLLRHRTR